MNRGPVIHALSPPRPAKVLQRPNPSPPRRAWPWRSPPPPSAAHLGELEPLGGGRLDDQGDHGQVAVGRLGVAAVPLLPRLPRALRGRAGASSLGAAFLRCRRLLAGLGPPSARRGHASPGHELYSARDLPAARPVGLLRPPSALSHADAPPGPGPGGAGPAISRGALIPRGGARRRQVRLGFARRGPAGATPPGGHAPVERPSASSSARLWIGRPGRSFLPPGRNPLERSGTFLRGNAQGLLGWCRRDGAGGPRRRPHAQEERGRLALSERRRGTTVRGSGLRGPGEAPEMREAGPAGPVGRIHGPLLTCARVWAGGRRRRP